MYRRLAGACVVAAAGLLGWAGYSAVSPPSAPDPVADGPPAGPDGSGLVVVNADQDLGELPLGAHRVVFRVANRSDRPGEVVGGTHGCRAGCCFGLTDRTRVPVPPGETVEVAGELEVHAAGPVAFDGTLFLNDGGQLRWADYKLAGVGVAPGGKPHAPPP